jgi:tetratricopeptide (TPR) repeat protein
MTDDFEDLPAEAIVPAYDAETLREIYDDVAAARARAEELCTDVLAAEDTTAELLARTDLVDLLLGLGELDEALTAAQQAADRADMAGTAAQQHLARIRLARAYQYAGDYGQANAVFTELAHAAGQFGPVIEAFTAQAIGGNDYDQGHFAEARERFARALAVREQYELPEHQIEQSRVSLAAAIRKDEA